ncbi:hypothetical protein JB92DRAFT_3144339 [Gautieria morchelliformis]|nr:hypothetical protein JB92DRAFT_3144339 [Gautieria morchelliformis]
MGYNLAPAELLSSIFDPLLQDLRSRDVAANTHRLSHCVCHECRMPCAKVGVKLLLFRSHPFGPNGCDRNVRAQLRRAQLCSDSNLWLAAPARPTLDGANSA